MRIAVNALVFYAAWFACALGGANGWPWTGAGVAAGAVLLHLAVSRDWQAEAKLALAAALIGVLGESALIAMGAVRYASAEPFAAGPPVWLIAMWFAFAMLTNVTFFWLRARWAVAALLGAALGPISYVAGEALGALQINAPYWQSTAAIAVLWAIAFPLIVKLGEHWDGVSGRRNRQ